MAYGFFMKLVVADRLAIYVDTVYNSSDHHTGTSLLLATLFFSFQIYCDFAAYSSIAIGASRVMGIYLMTNFKRPYLSRSVVEFWRRWHISLSTWFKDYLYVSLGGNRVATKTRLYFNLMVTFLVSGLWHGANWTFVIWGGLNGFYLVIENMVKDFFPRFHVNRVIQMLYTFVLINVSWIFFRSYSFDQAIDILKKIVSAPGKLFVPPDPEMLIYCFLSVFIVIAFESIYEFLYHKRKIRKHQRTLSNAFMIFLILCIVMFGVFDGGQFIYFQF
jgi:D-alanyl-lipoteichoic acid acyltransferase DltB (MBOAT superfamily)